MEERNVPEKVSVIMGIYGERQKLPRLKESIRSVLDQDWPNLELIMEDSGSAPEISAALEKMASSDPRIILVRETENHSLPAKLNVCLKYATGQFIARQDDDDLSERDRFTKEIAFLEEHPEIDFVGSNVWLEDGGVKGKVRKYPQNPSVRDFLFVLPFCHPTLMFRRKVFETIRYSLSHWCILCEDYDLLMQMYEAGFRGANIQQPLFAYHVGADDYKKRKFKHRINESVTRWHHFSKLNLLPGALPYVVKPVIVGLVPEKLRAGMRKKREAKADLL